MDEKPKSKSNLKRNKPTDRNCESCPRWQSLCKSIYNDLGELPKIESCPIWNGEYNVDTKLWYYQNSDRVNEEIINEIKSKVDFSIKRIKDRSLINITLKVIDEDNYAIFFDYKDLNLGVLPLYIEKRKIDILVHDGDFLYNLLSKLNMMTMFVKMYQYMKKRFKKLHLKGTANRMYCETFEAIKLDDLIVAFFDVYNKSLEGLLFTIETSDENKVKLDSIY